MFWARRHLCSQVLYFHQRYYPHSSLAAIFLSRKKIIINHFRVHLGAVELVQALLELDEEERGEEHHHQALHRKAGHGEED